MRADYREWLVLQEYSANTISTQSSHALRIEHAYGDLDALHAAGGLDQVADSLRYTAEDTRRNVANPSKIVIGGDIYKSLASFRTALGLYRRFLATAPTALAYGIESTTRERPIDTEVRERIGLERDLQKALRREISQLEAGLVIIDDGVERSVPSGFIDITAQDSSKAIVVIELKAGTADRAAIG